MKLNTRMADSMVLKWQLEWVAAPLTIMATTSLMLALMAEPIPTELETRLK
jgi:hypothetical protein